VTFRQSNEYLKLAVKGVRETTQKTIQKTVQKTTKKILEAIRKNSNITRKELAFITGISENA
jgi:DNA-binding transcriptional regulator YiaG